MPPRSRTGVSQEGSRMSSELTSYHSGTLQALVPNCSSSRYAGKRQRTAALQDATAFLATLLLPQGLGVRLSSAAFVSPITANNYLHVAYLGWGLSHFRDCRFPKAGRLGGWRTWVVYLFILNRSNLCIMASLALRLQGLW